MNYLVPFGIQQLDFAQMMVMQRKLTMGAVFWMLGKLVAHAALEMIPMLSSSSYGLQKSSGIELSNSQHEMAISSWSNLVNSLYIELATTTTLSDTTKEEDDDPLLMIRTKKLNAVFVHGSFLDVDLSDATHIFVASLCMSSELLLNLAQKLATYCPNLEVVATMRPFQDRNNSIDHIPTMFRNAVHEVAHIQTTWTQGAGKGQTTHVYRLKHEGGN